MDNDVFGHVNNAHYYSLFDTAVCEFLVGSGILTWRGSDHYMVVAESGCRYHSEVAFPDQITAGLRVMRLGTQLGPLRHRRVPRGRRGGFGRGLHGACLRLRPHPPPGADAGRTGARRWRHC